ncbi:MAG: hypothetical protein COY68_02515 [Candidatus Levybacteria bacterium CG_4_10_14_0_8_um_filter_35_23]|nr:MAG: hypothetical protein COY68_02515 [Candidatus Levybacteria bacterium CG_4_10_14_0_8_um_filter_35_23]
MKNLPHIGAIFMEELNLSTPILSNPDNESSAAEQKEEKNNFGEKQKKAFWNFSTKQKDK